MKRTKKIVIPLLILAMVFSLTGIPNAPKTARAVTQTEYRMLEGEERFLPLPAIAESSGSYKSVKSNSSYLKVTLVKDAKNPGLQAQALFCPSGSTSTTTVATVNWYDKKAKANKHFNITVHIVLTPPMIDFNGTIHSFSRGTANFELTMDEGETGQLRLLGISKDSVEPETGWYTKTTNSDVITGTTDFEGDQPVLKLKAGTASLSETSGGVQASTLTATLKFDQNGFTHIYTMKFRVRVNDKTGEGDEEENIISATFAAPFQPYYEDYDDVSIESADLKDDFGIGLPTDGSDALSSDEKVTAIRVIAKVIRNYIMGTRSIGDKKEANGEMKKYIRYKSGVITGLSLDGTLWNTGVFSDPKAEGTEADGYWQLFVDNQRISTSLEKTSVGKSGEESRLWLVWIPTQGVKGEPGYREAGLGLITDEYGGYEIAGQDLSFRVLKAPYDEKVKGKYDHFRTVTGAAVDILGGAGQKLETIDQVSEIGEFTLKKSYKPGLYTLRAYEPVTTADGKTTSDLIYATLSINLIKKIKVPKNVTATVDGTGKATVTWKGKKSANDYYVVEGAKKEDGKYKTIGSNITGNKFNFTYKPKTAYVRIKHFQYYSGGEVGRWFESNYTAPIQVTKKTVTTSTAAPSPSATSSVAASTVAASSVGEAAFTEKEVAVRQDGKDTGEKVKLRFYAATPNVAYIDFDSFQRVAQHREGTTKKYEDGTYTLSTGGISAVVDVEKDTFSCADYDRFFNDNEAALDGKMAAFFDSYPYLRMKEAKEEGTPKQVSFDLGKYGFDIIGDENGVYFPLCILNDIMGECVARYALYNGTYLFLGPEIGSDITDDPEYAKTSTYLKGLISGKKNREPDMAEAAYNQLAFFFDNIYGFPSAATSWTKVIREKGFEGFLTEYEKKVGVPLRNYLKSDDFITCLVGMNLLNRAVYDGGHTLIHLDRALYMEDGTFVSRFSDGMEKLLKKSGTTMDKLTASDEQTLREEKKGSMAEPRIEAHLEAIGSEQCKIIGDTALVLYDSFVSDYTAWQKYYAEGGKLPKDSLGEFIKALRKAKADPHVKNIVIDLSSNSGGSLDNAATLLALIGKEAKTRMYDRLTDCYMTMTYQVDRNFDRTFDESDDTVSDDIHYALLTSVESFSCANFFPALAKEVGVPLLGEKSGGGSCAIDSVVTAEGLTFNISDGKAICMNPDGTDVDGGIEVDHSMVGKKNGKPDYSHFYDIARMSEYLDEKYDVAPSLKNTIKIGKKNIVKKSIKLTADSHKKSEFRIDRYGTGSITFVNKNKGKKMKYLVFKKGKVILKKGAPKGAYRFGISVAAKGSFVMTKSKTVSLEVTTSIPSAPPKHSCYLP